MGPLESLQTESVLPVALELRELLGLVEVRHGQFGTPERSVASQAVGSQGTVVRVPQDVLVERRLAKVPNVFLVESVVDNRVVGVRRVVVERLTLNIVKLK